MVCAQSEESSSRLLMSWKCTLGKLFCIKFYWVWVMCAKESCIIAFRALRRLIGNSNLIVMHFRAEQLNMADGHWPWWSILCVRNIQMRSNPKLSFRFGRNRFGSLSNTHFVWLIEFRWNCVIDKSRNTSISWFIFHSRFNLIEILLRVILLQKFLRLFLLHLFCCSPQTRSSVDLLSL